MQQARQGLRLTSVGVYALAELARATADGAENCAAIASRVRFAAYAFCLPRLSGWHAWDRHGYGTGLSVARGLCAVRCRFTRACIHINIFVSLARNVGVLGDSPPNPFAGRGSLLKEWIVYGRLYRSFYPQNSSGPWRAQGYSSGHVLRADSNQLNI